MVGSINLEHWLFYSSGNLQEAQLPKTIENFDTTAKLSENTFISTHLTIVSQ